MRFLKWTFLSGLSGLLAGIAATALLDLLARATELRSLHPQLIWFLPFAGLIVGWAYHRHGQDIMRGSNLILDEVHDPKKVVPLRMAPFVFIGTLASHLCGASVGREGAIVQIGASLSDQLGRLFRIPHQERKILLMAGMGAGFGAALGTPWAGMIFGMEVIAIGRLRFFAVWECGIAAWVAYGVTRFLHIHHTSYPLFDFPAFEWNMLFWVAGLGMLCGFSARIFVWLTHAVEWLQERYVSYPPFKPFLGGVLLLLFYYLEGSYRYAGLGIGEIQNALQTPADTWLPVGKMFLSALSVGSGFKGGEFVPLVFIGSTLGSALGLWLPISYQLLGALGFAAVFAGAANTPVACTIMAIEIFGPGIGLYALLACGVSYYFSGPHGIYAAQRERS